MSKSDFAKLEVYRLAEEIALSAYECTKRFPNEELYGITSQLKRAAISIAINIAESYGRFHFKDKVKFLYNSRGSLFEVKSIVLISCKLGFIKETELNDLIKDLDNLGVKLNNYISYLKKRSED
ncbi:four helix bundle protein [Patescibacteria group bacterium]